MAVFNAGVFLFDCKERFRDEHRKRTAAAIAEGDDAGDDGTGAGGDGGGAEGDGDDDDDGWLMVHAEDIPPARQPVDHVAKH